MFFKCSSLNDLDIRNLTIGPKCTKKNMFALCSPELWEKLEKQKDFLEFNTFEELY